MVGKDERKFHTSLHVTTITLLLIGIIITSGTLSAIPLALNLNHSVMAQVQQQQQQLQASGNSFQMGNMTFSHNMASVNGIKLHYVTGGHGPPVVLLHGWPETWYEWHKIMPALAKNYTVIAPDLRGLGDTSKPYTGYDGNNTAKDIYQLLSQLRTQKIYLVGHDVGVLTAYSYAASHPSNVSKLVILDVPPLPPPGFEKCCWWFGFHQTPYI